jgi:hypothetical protein
MAVGIVFRLWAVKLKSCNSIPDKGKRFLICLMCLDQFWGPLGEAFPWGKVAGGVKLTTLISSAEVKDEWKYTATLPYAFVAYTGTWSPSY